MSSSDEDSVVTPDYSFLLHPLAVARIESYLAALRDGGQAGVYLHALLQQVDLGLLTFGGFTELLVRTKHPQIFAESTVRGDGSDWNITELSLLGDLSVAVPVTVYDNGLHSLPAVHEEPFPATLLFTPGALLRNGQGCVPADWPEVVTDRGIDPDAYYRLYERRLLPCLLYASRAASHVGTQAVVTIPGLGCGQFAGKFAGQLAPSLEAVLQRLVSEHHGALQGILAIYFDPYAECVNSRREMHGIILMTRPLTMGNGDKPQLCHPSQYQDSGDDFSRCRLFSVVAWDHVSWPGNDFFAGSRCTDDGVKAAATDAMRAVTGVAGSYSTRHCEYRPPGEYHKWEDVVVLNELQLTVEANIEVLPEG